MGWLIVKEWRGLMSSRAWWLMVVAGGPIVGVSFQNAIATYADVSADPGCGIACSPLLGIWAPTFGAYEIIAMLLLPFVAIRSLATDRQNGALTLELQRPFPPWARVGLRVLTVLAGWGVVCLAGALAVLLWASYGGHISAPELAVVAFGHVLNAVVTIAVAFAIAAMTDHPSTAAVATLALTIGTWAVDFAAAVYGGWWESLAAYTPAAFVGMFQHGLVRTGVVLAAIAIAAAAVGLTAVWIRPGVPTRRRSARTAVAMAAGAGLAMFGATVPGSWDASETRVNSFAQADADALARIDQPIRVEVRLAPQDARRAPFDRGPLAKLRRTAPHVEVTYLARTSTGMYEQADAGYGEVRYAVGDRTGVSRALTDEAVVEMVLDLAGVSRGAEADSPYRGYPLPATATGASVLFFLIWPAVWAGTWFFSSRRHS